MDEQKNIHECNSKPLVLFGHVSSYQSHFFVELSHNPGRTVEKVIVEAVTIPEADDQAIPHIKHVNQHSLILENLANLNSLIILHEEESFYLINVSSMKIVRIDPLKLTYFFCKSTTPIILGCSLKKFITIYYFTSSLP